MTEDKNDNWATFEANKLLLEVDPTLTEVEKERIMTRLTNELVAAEQERTLAQLNDELTEKEKAAGLYWRPLFALNVENATEAGSGPIIDLRKETAQQEEE